MKKFIAVVLTIFTLLSCTCMVSYAKVGDIIGTAYHTDIVCYINNCAVPSYAVNGTSVIVAEDLNNFCFDVVWNGNTRSLNISSNYSKGIEPMFVGKGYATGTKFTNILATDISVWANGRRITSYAMNGYTMIPVEELAVFGEVIWDPQQRALKLWIDGVEYPEKMQPVSHRYYPGTSVPDYGWITESICFNEESDWEGTKMNYYISDYADVQAYIRHIKSVGFVLDLTAYDADGYYEGYINHSLRQGVLLQEVDGIVYVQVEPEIDRWVE